MMVHRARIRRGSTWKIGAVSYSMKVQSEMRARVLQMVISGLQTLSHTSYGTHELDETDQNKLKLEIAAGKTILSE